jgi:hypothetical protein
VVTAFSLSARLPMLGVRAAGKKKGVVTVAGVNSTFNMLCMGVPQQMRVKAEKAVAEIKGPIPLTEGRKRDSVAHRLGIVVNDVLGGSSCPLLDGRIDLDRCERDVAHLPLQFSMTSCSHVKTPLNVAAPALSRGRLPNVCGTEAVTLGMLGGGSDFLINRLCLRYPHFDCCFVRQ